MASFRRAKTVQYLERKDRCIEVSFTCASAVIQYRWIYLYGLGDTDRSGGYWCIDLVCSCCGVQSLFGKNVDGQFGGHDSNHGNDHDGGVGCLCTELCSNRCRRWSNATRIARRPWSKRHYNFIDHSGDVYRVVPIIVQLGYDKIWFGILMIILVEMALITPPVGLNLYVVNSARKNGKMSDVIIGSLPYVGVMILMIILLIAYPSISLYLPNNF